jgi:hypothetical protein
MENYLIKEALLSSTFTEKLRDFDFIYQGDGKIAVEFCYNFRVQKHISYNVRLLLFIFTLIILLIF